MNLKKNEEANMMNTEKLEEILDELDIQGREEIIRLKTYLSSFSDEDIRSMKVDDEQIGEIVTKIVFTVEGLRKIASVMEFMDAYEEAEECPHLSRNPKFDGVLSFT